MSSSSSQSRGAGWPHRGEIWKGYMPGQPDDPHQPRYLLIISLDVRNRVTDDVITVPIFTRGALGPPRVRITAGEGGILHNSVVFCDEVTTIDRDFLQSGPLGPSVSDALLGQVVLAAQRHRTIIRSDVPPRNPPVGLVGRRRSATCLSKVPSRAGCGPTRPPASTPSWGPGLLVVASQRLHTPARRDVINLSYRPGSENWSKVIYDAPKEDDREPTVSYDGQLFGMLVTRPGASAGILKTELVGDFKNGGREGRPTGEPEEGRGHDVLLPELGRVSSYRAPLRGVRTGRERGVGYRGHRSRHGSHSSLLLQQAQK